MAQRWSLLALLVSSMACASAATVPSNFSDSVYASGLSNPTAMAWSPDGRLFVCTQGGSLRVIKNGTLLATPFVRVTVDSNGERGLLGVAFDPNFSSNRLVYVQYTATSPATRSRISRFTADSGNPDVSSGGEQVLFDYDNLSSATNHNGGALHFGPDGKLYSAHGENANGAHAQTLNNLLGKILRLNSDGTIPSDNPFFNQATGNNRAIYALGLRNPFTFAFQPGTGRLYINDVGQGSWEEINDGAAGRNYGWPNVEGNGSFSPAIGTYSNPVRSYPTSHGCAITGGTFYNPSNPSFPGEYVGKYFFADYCGNWIRYIDPANPGTINNFASGLSAPVDLKIGPDGALYYIARGNGAIGRIQYTVNTAPAISQQPSSITVSQGATATFTISASGSPPLSYQWERAASGSSTFVSVGSSGNSASYTTPSTSASDNGANFRVVVSNSAGSTTSNSATLTVTSNTPPSVTISSPAGGGRYNGGSVINYAGSATDTQDGNVPASRFSWTVRLHHQSHTHPFLGPITNQSSGSFTIPVTGETDAVQWYEIILTVSDSAGLSTTVSRRIDPNTANFTLASNPAGLQLTLDSQPLTASQTITGVVGMTRTLGVVSPQTLGSSTYTFASWSDGGSASHTISTPSNATTYTANFQTTALAPSITTQPTNQTVTAGDTATFTVVASGTGPLTYQWKRGTTNVGTNSATLTLTNAQTGDAGSYTVVVTNSAGTATSNAATLSVNAVTLRDPENPAGAVAGLTYAYYAVSTDGTIPNLAALVPTATGTVTTFDLSPRTRDDNIAFAFNGYLAVPTDGVYTLFTSSDDGSRLLIGTTTVVDNDGPHGMQERSGVIGLKAGRHALTVHFAQGAGGFGLEVRWEGPGIAKALVPASALFRTGTGTGTVPTITIQPVNRSVVVGATATFTVTASGTPAPTFQWQKNNVNIDGATSASYTTPATVIGDNSTTYRCVATNSAGTATSTSATLTVTTVVVVPQTPVAPTVSGAGTATPILSGTSDAGATIRIYDGATLIGTVTANGSGAWTFSPTLTPGTHQITITATNSAGTSAASPPVTVVIPTAPGVPTPVPVPATSSSNSKSCGMGSLAALGAVLGLTGLLGLLRREQR